MKILLKQLKKTDSLFNEMLHCSPYLPTIHKSLICGWQMDKN